MDVNRDLPNTLPPGKPHSRTPLPHASGFSAVLRSAERPSLLAQAGGWGEGLTSAKAIVRQHEGSHDHCVVITVIHTPIHAPVPAGFRPTTVRVEVVPRDSDAFRIIADGVRTPVRPGQVVWRNVNSVAGVEFPRTQAAVSDAFALEQLTRMETLYPGWRDRDTP